MPLGTRHCAGLVAPLIATLVIGCASPSSPSAEVGTSEGAATIVSPLATALTKMGFHLVRTERISYEADRSTSSEIVCTEDVGAGARSCRELVCVGSREDGTRLCMTIVQQNGRFFVTGTTDRYEHDDGRVAYVASDPQRLVGAVRRGTHVFEGKLGVEGASVTLVVRDLGVDARGTYQLTADVRITRGAEHIDRAGQTLAFDAATSRFAGDGVSVSADADTGLLRDLRLTTAAGDFEGTGKAFTSERGDDTASLVEAVARWFLPLHVSSGPGCDPTTGIVIDVDGFGPERMNATVRYTSDTVRAPNGQVIVMGPTKLVFPNHQLFVNDTFVYNATKYHLPLNSYTAIITTNDATQTPKRTEGFSGEYGWPYYLDGFPIHPTCVATRMK